MTVSELKVRLFEEEVSHYYYSIGSDEDQRVCMVESGGRWIVYYSEDGEKQDVNEYSNEADACNDLYRRVSE